MLFLILGGVAQFRRSTNPQLLLAPIWPSGELDLRNGNDQDFDVS